MAVSTFEFATAGRIVFGRGALAQAAPAVKSLGSRALIVTGRNAGRAQQLVDDIRAAGLVALVTGVQGEPTLDWVRATASMARDTGCNVVAALGGGSAIDAGKAVAALVTNAGDPLDYLEVIGAGKPLSETPLPFVAIPTTAGTGSEVTRNAVLGATEQRVKVSLRSAAMLPRVAIVDPLLSVSTPPAVTASTGLDALTQLIEPFLSPKANPLTDALCRDGIPRIARSLRTAWKNGEDLDAREDMAYAALLGGIALANAGLGAVHGFAAPIGGMFSAAPHGAVCAVLLPHVLESNFRMMRSPEPLRRLDEVARLLTGSDSAKAPDAVTWVQLLVRDLQIPSLRSYGIEEPDFDAIATKAAQANSMKSNPVALPHHELVGILRSAW